MKPIIKTIGERVGSILASKPFLYIVIALFVVQAAWIAISYRYAMVFDEQYHYTIIQIFSHQWLPFITHEQPQYYSLRDLVHETSFLYHYLMSFPYRGIQLFTTNLAVNVIILRLINVAMVAVGLFGFAKLFRKVGIAQQYVNFGLLLVTVIPLFTFVAATINYDNMLFMVVPFYLIACLDAMREKKLSWRSVARVGVLGMFASLIKYTFLPLFAATLIFLVIYIARRDKSNIFKNIMASAKKADKKSLAIWLAPFVLLLAMFSGVYIRNLIVYHTPSPSCTQSMKKVHCMKSAIVERNVVAKATANQRVVSPLPTYTTNWFTIMWRSSVMSSSTTTSSSVPINMYSPPIFYIAFFIGIIVILAAILIMSTRLLVNREYGFLLFSAAIVVIAIYIFNVNGYYSVHEANANQPRYLIDAVPIIVVFGVYSLACLIKSRITKYCLVAAVIVCICQGGGIITHILASNSTWYWQNSLLMKTNSTVKDVTAHLVKKWPPDIDPSR